MFNPGSRRMAEHWGYFLLFQGTPVHSHYPHQVVHKPLDLQLQMIQHPLFFWPPFKLPHVSHTFTDSCVKLRIISKLNHLHFLSWEFMCPPPSFLFGSVLSLLYVYAKPVLCHWGIRTGSVTHVYVHGCLYFT